MCHWLVCAQRKPRTAAPPNPLGHVDIAYRDFTMQTLVSPPGVVLVRDASYLFWLLIPYSLKNDNVPLASMYTAETTHGSDT